MINVPCFKLPLDRSGFQGDHVAFMESVYSEYIAAIQQLSTPYFDSDRLNRTIKLSEGILNVLKMYFYGDAIGSYNTFVSTIGSISSDLEAIINNSLWPDENDPNFFRMRVSDVPLRTIEELCHVPFELRHLIDTQRYSISGYPSLYLASSVYVAWKEMRMPSLDKINTVKLKPVSDLKLIDFSYTPHYLFSVYNVVEHGQVKEIEEYMASYLICWPLLAACSVKSKYPQAAFKPEYIIPQLLLQTVTNRSIEGDWDGIKYFSMSASHLELDRQRLYNCVIPVKSAKDNGLCDVIKKSFASTLPLSWTSFNLMTDEPDKTKCSDIRIELLGGQLIPLSQTKIGAYEAKLCELPVYNYT
jgi:hypothetical protein